MIRSTRASVEFYAKRAKVDMSTSAPGDGVRRYRFEVDGHEYLCLGAREALKWLEGFLTCEERIRNFNGQTPEKDPTCVLCETGEEPGHEH